MSDTPPIAEKPDHDGESNTPAEEVSYPRLDRSGLMVAGIVHNLLGSLTAMLGHIDLLSLYHPQLQEPLMRVRDMGKRLQGEMKMMLDKSEIEAVEQVKNINLIEVIERELDFFRADPRLKHKIKTKFNKPDQVSSFHAPAHDLVQAFDQVLANAIEAMEYTKEAFLTITLEENGDHQILTMTDTGDGMDEAVLAQVYEPFFSTKTPRHEGKNPPVLAKGIGLTHVKNLLDPLGCSIDIQSEPKKGTTVTIEIPFRTINDEYKNKIPKDYDMFKRGKLNKQ